MVWPTPVMVLAGSAPATMVLLGRGQLVGGEHRRRKGHVLGCVGHEGLGEGLVLSVGGDVEAVDPDEGARLTVLDVFESWNVRELVVDAGFLDVRQGPWPRDEVGGLTIGEQGNVVGGRDRLPEDSLLPELANLLRGLDGSLLADTEVIGIVGAVRVLAEHVAAGGGVDRLHVVGVALLVDGLRQDELGSGRLAGLDHLLDAGRLCH